MFLSLELIPGIIIFMEINFDYYYMYGNISFFRINYYYGI